MIIVVLIIRFRSLQIYFFFKLLTIIINLKVFSSFQLLSCLDFRRNMPFIIVFILNDYRCFDYQIQIFTNLLFFLIINNNHQSEGIFILSTIVLLKF